MINSRVHLCFVRFRRDGTYETTPPALAVNTMNSVAADGRSNWMEGFILICMSLFCAHAFQVSFGGLRPLSGFYLIIAISFWFYPGESVLCHPRFGH